MKWAGFLAGAALLLTACGAVRGTASTTVESGSPYPSPTAAAMFAGPCKLPVSWGDASMGTQLGGGFVVFPGASFSPDSSASGLVTPFGANWVSYDAPLLRWVPVTRDMLSPDGSTWLYGTLRRGNEYHAVDVRTGTDTTLWGSDQLYRVIGLDDKFAYAMLDSATGAHLWRLPLDGSDGSQIKVAGTWQFVNGGSVWGIGSATLPAGAPYSLQRFNVQQNTVTNWVQLETPGNLVGFDANGAPIIQVGGPGGDVIVAPSVGEQRTVAKAFVFAKSSGGYMQLPAMGDAHGTWLAGTDGIYLSVNGRASKQSGVQAFPAGPCG